MTGETALAWLAPHHDGSPLYVSRPEPALGERVTVWLRVPHAAGVGAVTRVSVRVLQDGEPRFEPAVVDRQRSDERETW